MRRTPRQKKDSAETRRIRLEIESIAAGGDGVGRTDGLVVFVPRSAPGDIATVEAEVGKSLARGTIASLERASIHRVDPPCQHYVRDRCGGCQVQHMRYEAQLDAKRRIITDSFARIAKRVISAPEIVGSPVEWRYRRKLTLALRRTGGDWVMGLHPYDAPGAVFQLEDCLITSDEVLAVWREIHDARGDLPDADELRASVVLASSSTTVTMEGGDSWPARERFFERVPSATSLWWLKERGRPRLVGQRVESAAPASFTQVNPPAAALLHAHVVSRVLSGKPRSVVDAYAGTGDTAAPIAAEGVRVTAIELDENASRACGARLPEGSRSVAARVEDALPRALPADVVLLNPPRTGVHELVTRELEKRRPRVVIYVSCNPATLARDVARMPSYRVGAVKAFDMFPQTAHVETVCELVLN
jgi:23S rRNA (uracil1939-C5)-methyltransferase